MNASRLFVLLLALSVSLASCESGPATEEPANGDPEASLAVAGEYPVHCGCVVESIGRCGNYVEVEGEYLVLGGELGLGKMEFCGQQGLHATVAGTREGNTLVATSYQLVE